MKDEIKIKFIVMILEATQNHEIIWHVLGRKPFDNVYDDGEAYETEYEGQKLALLKTNSASHEMGNEFLSFSQFKKKLSGLGNDIKLLFLDKDNNIKDTYSDLSGLSNLYYAIRATTGNDSVDDFVTRVTGSNA